ncbi:hypothetical protein [Rhizosaccharibacter radicis]|uniref:Uncharacterized protein n=1 Tax=Rhizosaccharibacter radicis TaxID=2782605 RepID=A0ABT1VVH1_9PROT|nr:hypothetical protein [Acetobacteraceae bacterium KSS12]
MAFPILAWAVATPEAATDLGRHAVPGGAAGGLGLPGAVTRPVGVISGSGRPSASGPAVEASVPAALLFVATATMSFTAQHG